eukprot:GFUD01051004.1.p1 GENE.GFUD01051004.1~~GFUD01051004.1.p1  ORF type:complete len:409 (-),score=78.35 GFUD01051004.1:23-1249(-)
MEKKNWKNWKKKWFNSFPSRQVLLLILVLYILMLMLIYNPGTGSFFLSTSIRSVRVSSPKTILFWTSFYGDTSWKGVFQQLLGKDLGGPDSFMMMECPETRCRLTSNRSLLDNVSMYDAIVFNQRNLDLADLPPSDSRLPHQTYVHFSYESPAWDQTDKTAANMMNGLFNLSFSYRMDNVIDAPFGRFIKIENHPEGAELDQLIINFGKSNTNLAAKDSNTSLASMMVSNCHTKSGREDLVTLIQKLTTVNVYGQCGPSKCKKGDEECYKQIEKKNKFYLSFENSICKDYASEKLFRIMSYNTVPVVFNGANMSRLAPPHSHLNVMEYRSVRDLVEEMKRIAADDALFASFFWWKDYYRFEGSGDIRKAAFCDLCQNLHAIPTQENCITDFEFYWKKEAKCRKPEFIF